MLAYDPTAGELRTHYAGFFDPGFGYSEGKRKHGSRAALEVRARDVSFMVEHRQPVCKLAFERMAGAPDVLYGQDVGSNYQGQETMLSKHFAEQTAGVAQLALRGDGEPSRTCPRHSNKGPRPIMAGSGCSNGGCQTTHACTGVPVVRRASWVAAGAARRVHPDRQILIRGP